MLRSLLALVVLLSCSAHAAVTLDGNVFYYSDSFATTTTSTYTRLLWDFAASINLSKKGQMMIGWDYNSASFTDNVNSVNSAVTVTGMGPKVTYYFDHDNKWSLGFIYDLILNGTDSSSSSVAYQGTGMKGEFGYATPVSDSANLGLKLNYYDATFSETITNQTTIAHVSYHRSAIYPSICFVFRWD